MLAERCAALSVVALASALGAAPPARGQEDVAPIPLAERWRPVKRWVTALAFHPIEWGVVYAAFRDRGVEVSRDRGRTWRVLASGLEFPANYARPDSVPEVSQLRFSREVPPRLFAASQAGLFFLMRNAGWQRVDVTRSRWLPNVVAVAFDPTDALVVWAGTNRGTFRSADGGVTWESRCSGLPTGWGFPHDTWVSDIAVDPTDGQRILACTGGFGVFLSRDAGRTWERAFVANPSGSREEGCRSVTALGDGGTLAADAGYLGLFFSHDHGLTWTRPEGLLGPGDVLSVAADRPAEHLFAAGYSVLGGHTVWRSRDSGQSWEDPRPIAASWCVPLVVDVDPGNPLHVLVGTGQGVLESWDGALSWHATERPGIDVLSLAIGEGVHPVVYAGFDRGGVLKSTDAGRTWRPSGLDRESVTQLMVVPRSRVVIAGSAWNGLFRSQDAGRTWEPVRLVGVEPNRCGSQYCPVGVTSLLSDGANPPTLYAVLDRHGALHSNDLGQTWAPCGRSLASRSRVVDLALDRRDRRRMILATDREGLWLSRDRGVVAERVGSNLPTYRPVRVLSLDGGGFVAVSGSRLFRSTDALTWREVEVSHAAIESHREKVTRRAFGEERDQEQVCESTVLVEAGMPGRLLVGCDEVLVDVAPRPESALWLGGLVPASTSGYIRSVAAAGRLVFAANGYGIFRSVDGGVTWDVTLPLWLEPVEPEDS